MEHKEIVVQTEKVSCVGRLFDTKQRIEVTRSSGCGDPFCHGAGGEVTLETTVSNNGCAINAFGQSIRTL
jgi:hypothetical protein